MHKKEARLYPVSSPLLSISACGGKKTGGGVHGLAHTKAEVLHQHFWAVLLKPEVLEGAEEVGSQKHYITVKTPNLATNSPHFQFT